MTKDNTKWSLWRFYRRKEFEILSLIQTTFKKNTIPSLNKICECGLKPIKKRGNQQESFAKDVKVHEDARFVVLYILAENKELARKYLRMPWPMAIILLWCLLHNHI